MGRYRPCESCDFTKSNCLVNYIKLGNRVKKSGKIGKIIKKSGKIETFT